VKTRAVQIGTKWMRIGLAGGGAWRELTWEVEWLPWSGMKFGSAAIAGVGQRQLSDCPVRLKSEAAGHSKPMREFFTQIY